MKQFDKVWIIWLVLVCIWNFGWPSVPPIADVVVAVILFRPLSKKELDKYNDKDNWSNMGF